MMCVVEQNRSCQEVLAETKAIRAVDSKQKILGARLLAAHQADSVPAELRRVEVEGLRAVVAQLVLPFEIVVPGLESLDIVPHELVQDVLDRKRAGPHADRARHEFHVEQDFSVEGEDFRVRVQQALQEARAGPTSRHKGNRGKPPADAACSAGTAPASSRRPVSDWRQRASTSGLQPSEHLSHCSIQINIVAVLVDDDVGRLRRFVRQINTREIANLTSESF